MRQTTGTWGMRAIVGGGSVLALWATIAWAAAGDLDGSYGTGGVVEVAHSNGQASYPALALQSGGRAVLAGTVDGSATPAVRQMRRYAADGSPDASFGTGGAVALPGSSMDLALDDDDILVATVTPTGLPGVRRYLSNGAVDTSFGTGGLASVAVPGGSSVMAYSVTLQPDGKVLLAGTAAFKVKKSTQRGCWLARFHANGTVDTAFGSSGVVLYDPSTGEDRLVTGAVGVLGDGRIVVGVTVGSTGSTTPVWNVVCFTASGARDTSFGTRTRPNCEFAGLAIDAAGGVVALGTQFTTTSSGTSSEAVVTRYLASGAVDTSFGTGGATYVGIPALRWFMGRLGGIALQGSGDVVVLAWGETGVSGQADAYVFRLTSAGALDPDFGAGGIAGPISVLGYDRPWWGNLAVDPTTDRIYFAGLAEQASTNDRWWIARLLGS